MASDLYLPETLSYYALSNHLNHLFKETDQKKKKKKKAVIY